MGGSEASSGLAVSATKCLSRILPELYILLRSRRRYWAELRGAGGLGPPNRDCKQYLKQIVMNISNTWIHMCNNTTYMYYKYNIYINNI